MNSVVKLPIFNELESNLKRSNELIQVILGPRQVGKTTTVRYFLESSYKKRALYHSADAVFSEGFSWLSQIWQEAREKADLIVVDEIQKIENWSEVIKKLWDEDRAKGRKLRCLLLGSSSLEIQKGLSESLTGRFQIIRAYHWSYKETKSLVDMSFEEYLKYGGYPASYQFRDDTKEFVKYLKQSIVSTVIEKDILRNHTVKSPALFKQAFELIMSYPAQEISYTKLLGQLQDKGNTDLIKYYISLYEGAFLIKSLFKYSGKNLKTRTSSPKLLPMCPAFYFQDIQESYDSDERGRVFELVVGTFLSRLFDQLYYWRDGKYEVDYIAKVGKKVYAIEVKSGRRKSEKGLSEFCKRNPSAQKFFITPDNYQDLEESGEDFFER